MKSLQALKEVTGAGGDPAASPHPGAAGADLYPHPKAVLSASSIARFICQENDFEDLGMLLCWGNVFFTLVVGGERGLSHPAAGCRCG